MRSFLIIGAGLCGSVIARELAEKGNKIEIWERRDHIGGNMYDYTDEYGILVQKYGPHAFHTNDKRLYDYISRFEDWCEYKLTCGAVWSGKYTPTPFNFTTIDTFFSTEEAELLKRKLNDCYKDKSTETVVEVLNNPDPDIRGYAEYLFKNDYAPYTAKQWGISPKEIDPSVLKRVPLRFSYDEGYFDDSFQVMPKNSYTEFFKNMLNHPNITVNLGIEALSRLKVNGNDIEIDGKRSNCTVVYTGALDELFGLKYGRLPYRSLRFEWKHSDETSILNAPVVAYPQDPRYTRITEYNKIPVQQTNGSTYALEYPIPYGSGGNAEPYYPVLTEKSKEQYEKYKQLALTVKNLVLCGRLADFKYYNIDEALNRALETVRSIERRCFFQ